MFGASALSFDFLKVINNQESLNRWMLYIMDTAQNSFQGESLILLLAGSLFELTLST